MKMSAIEDHHAFHLLFFQLSLPMALGSRASRSLPCCHKQSMSAYLAGPPLPAQAASQTMLRMTWVSAPKIEIAKPNIEGYHPFLNHSPEVILIFALAAQGVQRHDLPLLLETFGGTVSTRQARLNIGFNFIDFDAPMENRTIIQEYERCRHLQVLLN